MKIDQNTVILVTGGASGLGRAACLLFSKYKAKIVVADINKELGEVFASSLATESIFIEVDVASESSIISLIDSVIKRFGAIHVLINSAGIHSLWPIMTSEGIVAPSCEFHKVFSVNVLGLFNMSKYCAQIMMKQPILNEFNERGVIINVSSIQGIEGMKSRVIYTASKGAILGMTIPMARDLGKYGIRVVCIAPGAFDTPLQGDINEKDKKIVESEIPIGRFGKPEEFAELALEVARNSYINGVDIRVDGGIVLTAKL